MSDIAHPDWPEDWPTLMNELLQLITGSTDATDGGMRVLNDFVGTDLTEDQLLPIAREMLPQLLVILGAPQVRAICFNASGNTDLICFFQTYSFATRARSILIFRQCVMTLFTVKDEHPAAVKSAVSEILPQWIDACRRLLAIDITSDLSQESWEALAIRTAVYHVSRYGAWDSLETTLMSTSFDRRLKLS